MTLQRYAELLVQMICNGLGSIDVLDATPEQAALVWQNHLNMLSSPLVWYYSPYGEQIYANFDAFWRGFQHQYYLTVQSL